MGASEQLFILLAVCLSRRKLSSLICTVQSFVFSNFEVFFHFFFWSSSSQITHLPGFSLLPSCSNTGLENCDPSHLDSLKDFAMPREAGNFDVPFSEYPSYLHVEFVSAFGGNFWAFLFRSCMLSYSGNLGFFFFSRANSWNLEPRLEV